MFLTYRASPAIDAIAARVTSDGPLYDFVAPDGVAHTIWRVAGADVEALVGGFAALPALYIADGHHRAASAARARAELRGSPEAARFVAVAFPDAQTQISAVQPRRQGPRGRDAGSVSRVACARCST